MGCVAQPADAANIARVIALRAGIPDTVSAVTVHRNCASGFESVTQAAEKMMVGRGDVFVAGGTENMSLVPLLYSADSGEEIHRARPREKFQGQAHRRREFPAGRFQAAHRPADWGGLSDPVSGLNMGQTAENVARDFNITREEQDRFFDAVAPQGGRRQGQAQGGNHALFICPRFATARRISTRTTAHARVRPWRRSASCKPVFEKVSGSVTAGNASQITDGAVALLMMTEKALKPPVASPRSASSSASSTRAAIRRAWVSGPVHAIHKAEQRHGFSLKDADLIEVNEAFAAQVIGCQRAARDEKYCREKLGRDSVLGEIPDEILNVNGGAIALGHPVGVTGARLVLTALKELARRKAKRALLSLCVGGGQGGALWVETV